MSNKVNTDLLERAKDMADYWVGTPIQRVIDECIKRDDLEGLQRYVAEAEGLAAQEEIRSYDVH